MIIRICKEIQSSYFHIFNAARKILFHSHAAPKPILAKNSDLDW